MKKRHYYSFAFSYSEGNQTTTAYIGYDCKYISMPQIQSAKESAGINKDAVMLSCCYLGKMTEKEIVSYIEEEGSKLDATGSSKVIDYKIYDSAEMRIETEIQHSSTTLKIT